MQGYALVVYADRPKKSCTTVVYPKKSGCRGVNCASRGVNERENWRQSFRTDQETHPGVLYTNFYGTLSLKNNRLGRLLEIVVYPQFQGVCRKRPAVHHVYR